MRAEPDTSFQRGTMLKVLFAAGTICGISILADTGFTNEPVAPRDARIVIAHRGASAYLPEHTLPAKALAYGMGADFIEQDIVLSRDGYAVVLHDVHIDTVTNVAAVFPDRARQDGRYYAIDFDLSELKKLTVSERIDPKTNTVVFPHRFPAQQSSFRVATLAEEIELVQGLNRSMRRKVGIYPEIKAPEWHKKQGKDITRTVLKVLDSYGYRSRGDRIFLQCFDWNETRRIRLDLGCNLKLIQLVSDDDRPLTPAELARIKSYADGIGPPISLVISDREGRPAVTPLVRDAHQAGLVVHPYTLRADALPNYATNFRDMCEFLFARAKVDGVFTDHPDLAVRFRE